MGLKCKDLKYKDRDKESRKLGKRFRLLTAPLSSSFKLCLGLRELPFRDLMKQDPTWGPGSSRNHVFSYVLGSGKWCP